MRDSQGPLSRSSTPAGGGPDTVGGTGTAGGRGRGRVSKCVRYDSVGSYLSDLWGRRMSDPEREDPDPQHEHERSKKRDPKRP